MIDLERVRGILNGDVADLIGNLDGVDLDDTDAITNQTRSNARQAKAEKSKELLLLADRLSLAESLVRGEYWFARGESDPLDVDRDG